MLLLNADSWRKLNNLEWDKAWAIARKLLVSFLILVKDKIILLSKWLKIIWESKWISLKTNWVKELSEKGIKLLRSGLNSKLFIQARNYFDRWKRRKGKSLRRYDLEMEWFILCLAKRSLVVILIITALKKKFFANWK